MRYLIIALCLVLSVSTAFARKKMGSPQHGPAGCGLGTVLFEGKDGLIMHVLAATTNGTSGNQTFGMSTGTLGCEDASEAKITATNFIQGNRVALANDVARGDGETLNTYLALAEIPVSAKKSLQNNYGNIFQNDYDAAKIHQQILSYAN